MSVTGVQLKSNLSLVKGTSETLTATIVPDNASNKAVSWSSSVKTVATVDSNGKVTAVSAGTTDITVTTADGGKTATCKVTVTEAEVKVTGVVFNKTSTSLSVGETEQLKATVTPENATNQLVTYNSSDENKVMVSSTGMIRAIAAGTATITATSLDGGKTATCKVTVSEAKDIAVEGVELSRSTAGMMVGGSLVLTATVSPADATNKAVTWKSTNTSVATVTNGVVTAVGEGHTTISVSTADGNFTAICTVYVSSAAVSVSGVSFVKSSMTLVEGEKELAQISVLPATATNQNVTFGTTNPAVASVDANGIVTALSAGTTTITVLTEDGGYTAQLPVVVQSKTASSISVNGISFVNESVSVVVGSVETLTYNITPSNASNKAVTWHTSNDQVVRVNNGVIEAVAVGTATVSATTADGNYTAICKVEVTSSAVAVTGVTFTDKEVTLKEGESQTLGYVVMPSSATNKKVQFGSTNYSVASVDVTGKVTAISAGTANITVTTLDGNYTAVIKVTVTEQNNIVTDSNAATTQQPAGSSNTTTQQPAGNVQASVQLKEQELTLTVKNSAQLSATVTPANTELVWISSDTAVASVDANGKVTAVKPGKATIIVQTKDAKSSAICSLTVKPKKVTGFKKVKVGTKSVKLKWTKQANVKGYKIYVYNTKTKKFKVCKTINNKKTQSVTIKGLKKNTKYKFKIVSFVNCK